MKKTWTLILGLLVSPLFLHAQMAGSLDTTFNGNGVVNMQVNQHLSSFQTVKLQPDGKILTVGTEFDANGLPFATVVRFNEDGSLDDSFGTNGIYTSPYWTLGYDAHVVADNKILVVMDVAYSNELAILRLLPNGVPDSTYGDNGISSQYISVYSPVPLNSEIQPDGKVLMFGFYTNLATDDEAGFVARFLPSGILDSTFGGVGFVRIGVPNSTADVIVQGGALQSDGKIVVPGGFGTSSSNAKWYLSRLLPNGNLDPSFSGDGVLLQDLGPDFWEGANEVIILPDGKIVAAGYAKKLPGFHFTLVRFLADGTLDNTFGLGGKAQISMDCCYSSIFDIIQAPDGKLLVCGYASDDNVHQSFAIARFKANGIVDQTFGDGGRVILAFAHDSTSQLAGSMAIQRDGRILVAGRVTDLDGYSISGVVIRLNSEATVGTFSPKNNPDFQIEVGPNPVAGTALHMAYTLPEAMEVTISLFDLLGRKMLNPINAELRPQGDNKEVMALPLDLPAGNYVLKMETEQGSQLVKIVRTTP